MFFGKSCIKVGYEPIEHNFLYIKLITWQKLLETTRYQRLIQPIKPLYTL